MVSGVVDLTSEAACCAQDRNRKLAIVSNCSSVTEAFSSQMIQNYRVIAIRVFFCFDMVEVTK